MRVSTGQLILLALGVLFLSIGGGLIGGKWAAKRHIAPAAQGAARTVEPAREPEPDSSLEIIPDYSEPAATAPEVTAPVEGTKEGEANKPPVPAPAPPKPAAQPPTKPKETAIPTVPLTSITSRGIASDYVIQAISTPSEEDAARTRKAILAEGFPAGIFEVDLGERGKWYRVYVGPYETEAEAQTVLKQVRAIPGYKASFVKPLE